MSVFDAKTRVFTIPPEAPFLPALSKGLDEFCRDLAIDPPDITLYLPTQRSIRAFQAHLIEKSRGRPVLLPALKALGAVDEDEALLTSMAALEDELTLPPAITPLERIFHLQKEIKALGPKTGLGALTTPQRLMLARELGLLLDQMQNNGVAFDKVRDLAPDKYAEHWQEILAFLKIISETWPRRLEKMGFSDPVMRRRILTERLIAAWQKTPPEGPVIAAGSTGSVPLTRTLLKAIAALPRGAVILPGLDRDMDLEAWDHVEENHPQFAMKQTLESLRVARDKVADWPYLKAPAKAAETRVGFFKMALLPAPATTRWHHQAFNQKAVMASFALEEAPNPRAEAGIIALMMRRAAEEPAKTAALVTPDRDLAERVKAELERWNIAVDDSAGLSLLATPPAAFFNLLVEMAASDFSPVSLLAFLKHPLTTAGLLRRDLLALARVLDKEVLRGVAPGGGLAGLKKHIRANKSLPGKSKLLGLLAKIETSTKDLAHKLEKKSAPFSEMLAAHIHAARQMSLLEGDQEGLWAGTAGETLAGFLTRLEKDAVALGAIEGAEYPGVLRTLMEGERMRRVFPVHPRLFIWGSLEARLQSPDLLILGGLNEGTWPVEGGADPWMSRDMRKELGLPSADFRIGQAAHDFYLSLGAREVVITRAAKVEGTPATMSRWLQRASALLAGRLPGGDGTWLSWFEALDDPGELKTLAPPEPKPPVAVRPPKLSVTNIEKLIHDPYSIYAKYILKLKPLDDLEADPGAADRGLLLHRVFEVFFRENGLVLPDDPLGKLIATGRKVFQESGYTRPAVAAFWWPRFLETAKAFIETQRDKEKTSQIVAAEVRGALVLKTEKATFTVSATADRIDQRRNDKGLHIIDYKSGSLPTGPDMATGRKPQLPLEGLIAEAGGFEGVAKGRVAALEFWNVGKPGVRLEIKTTDKDIEDYIENARRGMAALIDHFSDGANPYLAVPDPSGHRFGDYDPLSRYHEWQNRPLPKGKSS